MEAAHRCEVGGECFGVAWMLMVWFSPFLNGCAVFVPKHALALAHASRGGKCKERGISHRNAVKCGRRPVCTSEARKTGDTPCARQGRSPSAGLVSLALRTAHDGSFLGTALREGTAR
jgi:hypothetical protein